MKPEVLQFIEGLLQSPVTTEAIIDAARPKNSPLHDQFEWDAKKAHPIYLKQRARELIREYWIEVNRGNELVRIRGSVSLPNAEADDDAPARMYYATRSVLSDADLRQRMLAQALRELAAFRHKYEMLTELSAVFAQIDSLEDNAA